MMARWPGASVTVPGEIKLTTGITANSTSQYDSVRRARFVVGSAMQFTGAHKFNDALVTDNIRRCGAYDDDEGFFFELDGSVFIFLSFSRVKTDVFTEAVSLCAFSCALRM